MKNLYTRFRSNTDNMKTTDLMILFGFMFVFVQLTRPAQDLLMSLCMNCNTHGSDDMEVVSNLIKIRLKPKVLLNHYMLCVR